MYWELTWSKAKSWSAAWAPVCCIPGSGVLRARPDGGEKGFAINRLPCTQPGQNRGGGVRLGVQLPRGREKPHEKREDKNKNRSRLERAPRRPRLARHPRPGKDTGDKSLQPSGSNKTILTQRSQTFFFFFFTLNKTVFIQTKRAGHPRPAEVSQRVPQGSQLPPFSHETTQAPARREDSPVAGLCLPPSAWRSFAVSPKFD